MTYQPLVLTRERTALLWQQLESFPELRDEMGMSTQEDFWAAMTDRRNLFYDIGPGLGLVAILHIRPGLDGTVFFVGFDRELRGKEDVFRGTLAHAFDVARLARVTAYTPSPNVVTVKLLARLGFQWEGVIRSGWWWGDELVDVQVNGLLRETLAAALEDAA